MAALTGYDTADETAAVHPDDVAAWRAWQARPDPRGTPPEVKVAPLGTLLRRVASSQYLDAPQRLVGKRAALRDVQALMALRNRAIHAGFGPARRSFADVPAHLPGLVDILSHLCLDHPAFPAAEAERSGPAIARHLSALSRVAQSGIC